MKPILLCATGLLLVFSITGCCCFPYKCYSHKKYSKSLNAFDQCGCSQYGASYQGAGHYVQQPQYGGQVQMMPGQQYMTGSGGCSACGSSTYPTMMVPPGQLQPTPTFQGSGSGSPTPAPPATGSSATNQPIPRPIAEEPAPIPSSTLQNGSTRQLQWVPSRL